MVRACSSHYRARSGGRRSNAPARPRPSLSSCWLTTTHFASPAFPPPPALPCFLSLHPSRQSSGVKVAEECLQAFQELKAGKKTKYIVYGMSADNTEIVVLKTSTDKSYETFLEDLPETECRWAVYDFEFDSGEGLRNKILFYMWCVPGFCPHFSFARALAPALALHLSGDARARAWDRQSASDRSLAPCLSRRNSCPPTAEAEESVRPRRRMLPSLPDPLAVLPPFQPMPSLFPIRAQKRARSSAASRACSLHARCLTPGGGRRRALGRPFVGRAGGARGG